MPAFWFDSSWPKTLQRVPHPLCAENLAVKLLWGFSKLIWRETTLLLFFFFFVLKLVFHWCNWLQGHTAPVCGGVRKVVGVCEQGWREEQDDSFWEQPTDQSHQTKPCGQALTGVVLGSASDLDEPNHSITGWFGVERTWKIISFQTQPWVGTPPTRPGCSKPCATQPWHCNPAVDFWASMLWNQVRGSSQGAISPLTWSQKTQQEKRWESGKWDLYLLKLLQSYANSVFHSHCCQNWGNPTPKTLVDVSRKGFCCYPIPSVQAAIQTAAGNYKNSI